MGKFPRSQDDRNWGVFIVGGDFHGSVVRHYITTKHDKGQVPQRYTPIPTHTDAPPAPLYTSTSPKEIRYAETPLVSPAAKAAGEFNYITSSDYGMH